MFTTNVEFRRWGAVLADDKLTAAFLDRVVRHGSHVEFGAPATGQRRCSCWASQEASSASVTEFDIFLCPNPNVFRD